MSHTMVIGSELGGWAEPKSSHECGVLGNHLGEPRITMMHGPEAASPTPLRHQLAGSASAPEAPEASVPSLFQFHRRSSSAPARVSMVKLDGHEALTPQATARAIREQFRRRAQVIGASESPDASDCDHEEQALLSQHRSAGICCLLIECCFGRNS